MEFDSKNLYIMNQYGVRPDYYYFRTTTLGRYTSMATLRTEDKNICRLCGEPRAVRAGRHPLLKENFSAKILEFAGEYLTFIIIFYMYCKYIVMLKRFIVCASEIHVHVI